MSPIPPALLHPDVLLIDASASSRYALRHLLQTQGARVRQVDSVERALPELRRQPPDAIVTARTLPGMNALELLALLRTTMENPPPVLIHTGDAPWPLAQTAVQQGAAAVLPSATLTTRLPALLRTLGERRLAAAPGTTPEPAPTAPAPTDEFEHQGSKPPVQRNVRACWRLAVVTGILGVIVGLWIGSLLTP
jgi:CheY-like chemotaxis protein